MDRLTKAQRSALMSRVTGNELLPERTLHRALREAFRGTGTRIMRNVRRLPGTPDFWIPRFRVAVQAHGCGWHSCPDHRMRPKTNQEYWRLKFQANRRRDLRNRRRMPRLGIRLFEVWECVIRKEAGWVASLAMLACAGSKIAAWGLETARKRPLWSASRLIRWALEAGLGLPPGSPEAVPGSEKRSGGRPEGPRGSTALRIVN